MPYDNLTVDTGLMDGSRPIYVGFLSMLAHIRRVFRRVFVVFFGRVGPIYVGFWLGFSWFLGLGFPGFWAGFSSFVVFGG